MRNRENSRLILKMKKHGIDVFDIFGRYNYVNTQEILPAHIHPDMMEICYLAKGCQEYTVGDSMFRMYGGDVFVTFPNERHGAGEAPEQKGILYWMVLKRPQEGQDYLGLSYEDASQLFGRLLQLPRRLFRGSAECEHFLLKIISTYHQSRGPLTKITLNNLLVAFLLDIIRAGERNSSRTYSDRISNIVRYMDDNLTEPLDLDTLAERCNLSVSRFKHSFKEETGIPPSEYVNRKKVEKAQKLMKEHIRSVADVAYQLGFSSPAYFSTVFKQYLGYSPSDYLKRLKATQD